MTLIFAYLGILTGATDGWPKTLMFASEIIFLILAASCIALTRRRGLTESGKSVVAIVGGICASFGLIMPFELAPFFFGAAPEIMMGTIILNLAYIPVAFVLVRVFQRAMKTT